MKEIAAAADFPLIWFHEQVRYIDITQDLHFALIRSHQRMIAELDHLTTSFNQLLLNGDGVQPLLRLLSRTIGYDVALYPLEGEASSVPIVLQSSWRLVGRIGFCSKDIRRGRIVQH